MPLNQSFHRNNCKIDRESTSAEGIAHDEDQQVDNDALRLPPPPSKGDVMVSKTDPSVLPS